jgi:lysophospholipase L1-like esterase
VTIRVALLGDSIAAGAGASRAADALGPRLVTGLAARGVDATTQVYAVSGARSSALRGQVDRALTWAPHLAVVVIGANDLTHRTPPAQAASALEDAVRRLRSAGVEVVVAPAPDLSAVPQVPSGLRAVLQAASAQLRDHQIAGTTAAGGHVADGDGTTSRAFAADPALFSGDRFHPSSRGYAVIAEALLPEVYAATTRLRQPAADAIPESAPTQRSTS